jgi:hypothetical protein
MGQEGTGAPPAAVRSDPLVAATPAAWVPFAQRNAELAAQLDRARWRGLARQ